MNYRILMAACAAIIAVSSPAVETNTANRILVTATRSIRPTETVPVHATVISGEKIQQENYTSVPEALSKKAGIFFRNYADNPSAANIDMRGFGENSHGRVLVLLNGRKVNSPDLATVNWSQISLRNIDRIEVLRGPGTAMYGDNANGGVVNIITKNASDTPVIGVDVVYGSYGFNDESIYTSGRINGLGHTGSFTHQSSDGYRDRSAYENFIWSQDLDAALTDNLDGRLSLSGVHRDYELPGDLTKAQKDADRRQSVDDSDVKDLTFNVDLGLKLKLNSEQALHLDTGALVMRQEANLNREYGPFATFMDIDKMSASISPKYTTTMDIGGFDNEFTLGSDIRHEFLKAELFADEARNTPNNNAEVVQDTLDLYAIDSFYLNDCVILSGAGRLNWNTISVKEETSAGATVFDDSKDRDQQSVSLGLTWVPTEHAKVYAKSDYFYRYPFVDEQASYLGFLPSAFVDLDPETGYNVEIGTDVALHETFGVQASAYYMHMQNEIAFDPVNFVNQNLDDTKRTGAELGADYAPIDLLDFQANYILTLSEFDSGPNKGSQIPGVPMHRAQLTTDVHLTDALTFTTDLRFTGKQYPINDNGNNADTQGAYLLTDIKLRYESMLKKCKYSVFAGIDNLFAEEYDYYQISNAGGTTVNYYPAAERTYKVGVGVNF